MAFGKQLNWASDAEEHSAMLAMDGPSVRDDLMEESAKRLWSQIMNYAMRAERAMRNLHPTLELTFKELWGRGVGGLVGVISKSTKNPMVIPAPVSIEVR